MIQDVKLGKVLICMPSVSVRSCSAFVWKKSSKNLLILEENHQKCGCGKGCGQKKGSNGVAYDDSYCDKF